jgi:hypothetical protein
MKLRPLRRKEAGLYASDDNRIVIKREFSTQTHYQTEVCWEVFVDGKIRGLSYGTLKEARWYAQRIEL